MSILQKFDNHVSNIDDFLNKLDSPKAKKFLIILILTLFAICLFARDIHNLFA